MNIFVKIPLNNSFVEKELTIFNDETIEITKSWNQQQVISGYGSYSKTFQVPVYENQDIFKYYSQIDYSYINTSGVKNDNTLDANYLLSARLVDGSFEIVGKIQIIGFNYKDNKPYSYEIVFFGDEKDLIFYLNSRINNKLNSIPYDNIDFVFNYENVVNSWSVDNSIHFVPVVAGRRPFVYRSTDQLNNINASAIPDTSGVSMRDLYVSYNFKELLKQMFGTNNLTLNHSVGVEKILYNLYLMPNNNVEYLSPYTYIFTQTLQSNFENVDFINQNILSMISGTTTTNGILAGNQDTTSWDNITDYTTSLNFYTPDTGGKYIIDISYNTLYPVENTYFTIMDYSTKYSITPTEYVSNGLNTLIFVNLSSGQSVQILTYYTLSEWRYDIPDRPYLEEVPYLFEDGQLVANVKIGRDTTSLYDFVKSTIKFPEILISDFFINFCKTFNIFFTFNQETSVVSTYTKRELPATTYDLTQYLLTDKDYSFRNELKYKKINYKFTEGKDINNISFKKSTGSNFGELNRTYNYDVGQDVLDYTSLFTTWPRTLLNETDNNNNIINPTQIPLHTELNESLATINTDYALLYKLPVITGITTTYRLQSGTTYYAVMDYVSDYGPYNLSGSTLDFNFIDILNSNNISRLETTLEFRLPIKLIYQLKIYDVIFINGVYWEIKNIFINYNNGNTRLNLINIPIIQNITQPTTTTTTTLPEFVSVEFNSYDNTNGLVYFNDNLVSFKGNTYSVDYGDPIEIELIPDSGYTGYLYQYTEELTNPYILTSLTENLLNLDAYFYSDAPSALTISFLSYDEGKGATYFRDQTGIIQPVSPAGASFTIPYNTEIYIYVEAEIDWIPSMSTGPVVLPLPYEDAALRTNLTSLQINFAPEPNITTTTTTQIITTTTTTSNITTTTTTPPPTTTTTTTKQKLYILVDNQPVQNANTWFSGLTFTASFTSASRTPQDYVSIHPDDIVVGFKGLSTEGIEVTITGFTIDGCSSYSSECGDWISYGSPNQWFTFNLPPDYEIWTDGGLDFLYPSGVYEVTMNSYVSTPYIFEMFQNF